MITHEDVDAYRVSGLYDPGDARRAMMHRHLDDGLCPAILWHGPGHQSGVFCRRTDEHEIHETVYHGHIFAEWRGIEAMTGFFDEPPELDD